MKKRIFIALGALAVSSAVVITLCSFTSKDEQPSHTEFNVETHTCCEGKKCTYTVGCDCSGFSPITDGKEWEKSYCKRCGHHKSYHK